MDRLSESLKKLTEEEGESVESAYEEARSLVAEIRARMARLTREVHDVEARLRRGQPIPEDEKQHIKGLAEVVLDAKEARELGERLDALP